jgi:hypothetical protein
VRGGRERCEDLREPLLRGRRHELIEIGVSETFAKPEPDAQARRPGRVHGELQRSACLEARAPLASDRRRRKPPRQRQRPGAVAGQQCGAPEHRLDTQRA